MACWIHSVSRSSVRGENLCDNPQEVCPRKPGEGYEKCQTVCRQMGHAEVQAIARARERGLNLRGATAVVQGHTYACKECQEALYGAGVAWIKVEPVADWGPEC